MDEQIEISQDELKALRAAAQRERKRKAAARAAAARHVAKEREAGRKRVMVDVSIADYDRHRAAGDIIVGLVWCPRAEADQLRAANNCRYIDMTRADKSSTERHWAITSHD